MLIVRINFEKISKKPIEQLVGDTTTYMYEIKDLRMIVVFQESVWSISTHDRSNFEPGWFTRCIDRVHISKTLLTASFYIIPGVLVELEFKKE